MKSFVSMFRSSAKELKTVRCLTVTGILIAVFTVLDMHSIRIGEFLKINLAFTALAAVGMLFGPVPAMLAALAGDLVGCILGGQAPLPLFSCTAMLEGLLYGILLYGKNGAKLAFFSAIARIADSLIISLILNTGVLMYYGFISRTAAQFYSRFAVILGELPVFVIVMSFLMPTIKNVYVKALEHRPQT